jgi:hypothetical protein
MYARTSTRSETVSITEARVAEVLRQFRVELINAYYSDLIQGDQVDRIIRDLKFMLLNDALQYFELRIVYNGRVWRAWRYLVSMDGTLQESSDGGGIDFFEAPTGAVACVAIERRRDLPKNISDRIIDMGWRHYVPDLDGTGTRERAYSKDRYGVIRSRYEG